jgi:hypothetical protein
MLVAKVQDVYVGACGQQLAWVAMDFMCFSIVSWLSKVKSGPLARAGVMTMSLNGNLDGGPSFRCHMWVAKSIGGA